MRSVNPDFAVVSPHQLRFLKVVEEHGLRSLEQILSQEVQTFEAEHPRKSLRQLVQWFSNHDVHVRMLAQWVGRLAPYLQQSDPVIWPPYDHSWRLMTPRWLNFDENRGAQFEWCAEVTRYLIDHKQPIPSSAGVVCPDIRYLTCNFFSEVYFLAVRIFASSSYDKPAEFYCHQSWVKKCLPPVPSKSLKFNPRQVNIDTLP